MNHLVIMIARLSPYLIGVYVTMFQDPLDIYDRKLDANMVSLICEDIILYRGPWSTIMNGRVRQAHRRNPVEEEYIYVHMMLMIPTGYQSYHIYIRGELS